MSSDKILAKKDGAIGSLIFNNPEKRNAFSLDMSLAAADVLEDFAADDAIRVVVLSGTGDKAFVSGGDISKFEKARATKEDVEKYNQTGARFRTLLRGLGKPTIAMIRGYCSAAAWRSHSTVTCASARTTRNSVSRLQSSVSATAQRGLRSLSILSARRQLKIFFSAAGAARRRRPCVSVSSITSLRRMSSKRS